MSLSNIRNRVDKIISNLKSDYWEKHYAWLDELSYEQEAKYWFCCYQLGYKEKLLPSIPQLEQGETNLDLEFWNGEGRDLFLEGDRKYQATHSYCLFCQIRGQVKSHLEREFIYEPEI